MCSWRRRKGQENGGSGGHQDQSDFGHALLERIIPAALGGTATLTSSADLLTYELSIPAAQFF